MAVYTEVSDQDLEQFVAAYDIGRVTSCKGIAEGVENSNYLLHTERGAYILTLYEKRVKPADLPFFLGFMEHLARGGFACPTPLHGRDGKALRTLCGRPAAIVTFLEGMWPRQIQPMHCKLLGDAMARMHVVGSSFTIRRENALGPQGWRALVEACAPRAAEVRDDLGKLIQDELAFLEARWPRDLPAGVIHADLFPDNVFFLNDRCSGVIDFYFACNDLFAYDLAICLNAWCFERQSEFNATKARLLLQAYQAVRPVSEAEIAALPILARGSALRFLLTRLYDWINHPAGAFVKPKDPLEYAAKLRFHQAVTGPGGWGAILRFRDTEKELSGAEPATTNNRMEMMAAISALEALKRPSVVRLYTDSTYVRDGITKWIHGWKKKAWKTADNKPVKNVDLWQRLELAAKPHKVEWHWVRGHDGHPENERADALARQALEAARVD